MGKSGQVFRITGARSSLSEDVRGRQRRYVISMLVRTVCVLLAVVLWDVQRRARRITLHGHANWVESVVFAPMGRTLVSAGGAGARPGEVCFWELGVAPHGKPAPRS